MNQINLIWIRIEEEKHRLARLRIHSFHIQQAFSAEQLKHDARSHAVTPFDAQKQQVLFWRFAAIGTLTDVDVNTENGKQR